MSRVLIISFYSEFVDVLDSITVPDDFELPEELPEVQSTKIQKRQKTKRKAHRPKSAPEVVKFPQLPSETLRRAVSARKTIFQEMKLDPLHTESFDLQLLRRLQTTAIDSEKMLNPVHPLVSAEKVTFQDAEGKTGWRTYSRPQSAVASAITTPRPPSSRPARTHVASRYLGSPSRPISSRPLTARSRKVLLPAERKSSLDSANRYTPLATPHHLKHSIDEKTMPLEWFDDLTFESRTGSEWVSYGPQNGQSYTIAYSRFYSYPESSEVMDWEWLPVNVISYDGKKDAYLVEWHCNGQQKQVKRLNLLFEGENRDLFYQRVEKALKRRYFSESMSLFA